MTPRERSHWLSLHSLGNGMAPIAYHHHHSDRSLRWRYPNLPHPSTLCHKLIPSEQWTPLSRRPGGLRSSNSLSSNTCSRMHNLRAALQSISRKKPRSAELRVLSSTTLDIPTIVIDGISRPGTPIKLALYEQSSPRIRRCLGLPSRSAPLAPRETIPLTWILPSGLRHWFPIKSISLSWVRGVCSAPGGFCV